MITFHDYESGDRIAILDKSSISMIGENSKEGCTEITFKEGADSEYTSLSVKEDFDTVCSTVTLGHDPKLNI